MYDVNWQDLMTDIDNLLYHYIYIDIYVLEYWDRDNKLTLINTFDEQHIESIKLVRNWETIS